MTDHHDHPRHGTKLVLAERRRRVVEMVGGLVEQQRARPADQHRREGEPATLPAGDRAHHAVMGQPAETEAVEDRAGTPVGVPGVAVLRPFQHLAVRGQQPVVLLRALHRVGERDADPVQLGEVGASLAQRVVEDGGDGGGCRQRHFLVQEADVRWARDGAGVRYVDAGEDPQQCRLAGAVLTDQTDPVAGRGGQGDAVEHPAVAADPHEVMGDESRSNRHGEPRRTTIRGAHRHPGGSRT